MAALDARLRYSCPSPRAGGHPLTTGLWQKLSADTSAPRYRLGTIRAAPPQATLRRLRPLLRPAGITRLADVTGLDWVGLAVFQAIRPNSRVLSVSQGKGLTREQGQVSALMEALEDNDDVQRVSSNLDIADDVLSKLQS